MSPKQSSIGNIAGVGFAKITRDPRGNTKCDGKFSPASEAEAFMLGSQEGLSFTGPVYDGGKEEHLTFPIFIRRVQGREVEFSSIANPYGKKP